MKSSGSIGNARIMVLGWSGAEDSPTADPVSNWGTPGDVTGPTWVANWAKILDSTQSTVTGTWTKFTVEAVDISSFTTVKNLAILVYIDDTAWGTGDRLQITGVRFENGSTANAYGHIDFDTELRRCQRYFNNTFDDGDDPRNASGEHTGFQMWSGNAVGANDENLAGTYVYPAKMRTTPTIKVYNSFVDTDNSFYEQRNGGDVLQSALVETITESRVNWTIVNSEEARVLRGHVEADAEF
jgi:hypothetical protein